MKKGLPLTGLLLLALSIASFADSLQDWATQYTEPRVQLKILQLIFPSVDTDLSNASKEAQSGMWIFPRSGNWVQLDKDFVWTTSVAPALVVTCILRNDPHGAPANATSYVLTNTTDRPTPITAGYAAHEKIEKIILPVLKKNFLLVQDSYPDQGGSTPRSSLFLLDLDAAALNGTPNTVWSSPSSAPNLQIAFAPLSSNGPEELITRGVSAPDTRNANSPADVSPGSDYSVYRWNGSRFEPDTMFFMNRVKQLPEAAWRHGTGR